MAQLRLTSKGLVLLFIALAFVMFGIGFGFWKVVISPNANLAPIDSSAGQCDADSPKECGGCAQKSNGESYACRWVGGAEGSCKEGPKLCGGGGGGGLTACTNPEARKTGNNCSPGSKMCQGAGGQQTGYQCTCVDLSSTIDNCYTVWQCNARNEQACKPDINVPSETSGSGLGTWSGTCLTGVPEGEYSVYSCRGQSYSNGVSTGCQDNGATQTITQNGGRICLNLASNFCGWIQIDRGNQHASAYYPCNEDEPDNPDTPNPTNKCDGGAVTSPTNSADYEVGETVVVKGYAFDTDGINKSKVVVKVDGVVAGNATVTDHTCASASQDAICTAAAGKKAVDWTYSYVVTTAGAHTFSVAWEDTKGLGGANCQGTRSITSNIQGNPDWEISKTGAAVCIDETAGNQRARVDYSISIKNVGNLAGQLTSLVDQLDDSVLNSYIQDSTITPDANASGNTITWDLSGSEGEFAVDEQKEFTYSIIVPQAAFGTLTNTATATPDGGDTFEATEVVIASCNPVPETALFDSAISKVVLGLILIGASGAYLYSDGMNKVSDKKTRKRKQFEERVAGN